MMELIFQVVQNICGTLFSLFIIRIFIVYLRIHNPKKVVSRPTFNSVKLMIPLGSGGHTFEMFRLIQNISEKFNPRIYVIAATDSLSEQKAKSFEESMLCSVKNTSETYTIEKIPRSREVGQSWVSTVFTTLRASIIAVILVLKHKPDIIVCNGPGTCVPLCGAAFLLHVLGLKYIKIVYVESICRVKTMSLSGKILYHLADRFLVQWPQLKEKYPKAKYIGKLI
ncbi:UDP-N-acetylglucosamine transferase subunit ALG14 homolog [Nephila pilipes]|uniref:UDP-N-acetylglucosamine transferase subunit ALG14 n=1 Tax=Nephila pilipes TaxID=299642 RepID=A0A8X6U5R6_NEPPI|nr:UDP-N-acetylglucosamine transferase subunit ALG14 homolog [Nephila pilipes]